MDATSREERAIKIEIVSLGSTQSCTADLTHKTIAFKVRQLAQAHRSNITVLSTRANALPRSTGPLFDTVCRGRFDGKGSRLPFFAIPFVDLVVESAALHSQGARMQQRAGLGKKGRLFINRRWPSPSVSHGLNISHSRATNHQLVPACRNRARDSWAEVGKRLI